MKRVGIFLAISLLVISTVPVFAQTTSEPLITVSTTESVYEEGDTIVVSGKVNSLIQGTPVTLQVFYVENLITIAQLEVAQDGQFTHTFRAEGKLWQNDGVHIIRASYTANNIAETTFEYSTKKAIVETTNNFEVDAGSSGTFDVEYTIKGGVVKNMIIDPDIFALVVLIESEADGIITLDMPRPSIDAKKSDGTDDTFIILIDGIEVPYQETVAGTDSRIITIPFEEGDSDIEIIGTFVVPEFGTLTMVILAVSIFVAIYASARKNMIKINSF